MNSQDTPTSTGFTVEQFDQLIAEMFAKKAEIEALEETVKEHNKELTRLKSQALMALKELNRENYKCGAGLISVQEKWSVATPKSEDDKKKFFDYLTEQGLFFQYATVNSQSLLSYFLQEREEAIRNGADPMNFTLPGVGEAKLFESLSMRKA